jgi:hypothetical protein
MQTERVSNPQASTLNYPLKVKHIFLTFLQEFCSMQSPDVLMYWNPDSLEESNIWITDSYAHDIESMVEKKPMIVFKRGPMYVAQGFLSENLVRMEDRLDPTWAAKGRDVHHNIEYRSFMMSGQADWQCISRQGMEAEQIATVVAMLHQTHKQVLKQKGMHELKSVQIGEEVMIAGDVETEMVMVPVTISYDIQAHYEYWEDGVLHEHSWIKGTVNGDMLLDTDP